MPGPTGFVPPPVPSYPTPAPATPSWAASDPGDWGTWVVQPIWQMTQQLVGLALPSQIGMRRTANDGKVYLVLQRTGGAAVLLTNQLTTGLYANVLAAQAAATSDVAGHGGFVTTEPS